MNAIPFSLRNPCLSTVRPSGGRTWQFLVFTLALIVLEFGPALSVRGQIQSDFDDNVYPGTAGNGWVAGWTNTVDQIPEIRSDNPIDGTTPYLHFETTGVTTRNVLRQYESGAGVDITQPHQISWKFRLDEDPADFSANFTSFNDRVHFFGRNAPRANGGTDASMSWAIYATGAAHSSGAGAGQTFWVYDNVNGDSAFNLANNVDTGVPLVPGDVYSFAVVVDPANQVYTVSIKDEDSGSSFTSEAPHKFRDLSATLTSHTYLHFGVQASSADEPRAFDLDSVRIESAAAPSLPPQIVNLLPWDQSIQAAEDGIQFDAVSDSPLAASAIHLLLNGTDVSGDLEITGDPTNRVVHYSGLQSDQEYTAVVTVENSAGSVSQTIHFNTATTPVVAFDSKGFEDQAVYPPGPLGPVTDGGGTWNPAAEPAQIIDVNDGLHGQVLRRDQTGNDNTDLLDFTPFSAGVLRIAFDARVSDTTQRTIDLFLQPASGGGQASMLGWGTNPGKLSYYDGSAWVAIGDLDTQWHHYEMISYLSGTLRQTFDLSVDGTIVGRGLAWRNSFAPGTLFGQLRLGGIRGSVGEYGDIDNLVITAEQIPAPPPAIVNLVPAHRAHFYPADQGLHFEATSDTPIAESDIHLTLNGQDVSQDLVIGGQPDDRTVSYAGLEPNTVYFAEIKVANARAEQSLAIQFNTVAQPTAILDTGGFEDNTLYPAGPLGDVTDGLGTWVPGREGDPSQIVASGDAAHGKVLRRTQTGANNVDLLDFTPFNSGVLTISFDARASTSQSRTLDLSLNRTGQDFQAASLAWGYDPGQLAYDDHGTWTDIAALDAAWHHYELVNYLDGPHGHTFDLKIDGVLVGNDLGWAQGFAAGEFFGRLRIAALNGVSGDYADLDNLVITLAPPFPAVLNLAPADAATFYPAEAGLHFDASSSQPIADEGIAVLVNGNDVTADLELSGAATNRSVIYHGLQPNNFYTATITVSNALGQSSTAIEFDTFLAENAVTIEAEDYNYENGQFQDDPPPSGYTASNAQINGNGVGYLDLVGTPGIDYSVETPATGALNEVYRFQDLTATRYANDGLRQKYVSSGAPDYELWQISAGDWQNYTRTFAAARYRAFLRASASTAQKVELDEVTSDPGQSGQATSVLGSFQIPQTSGYVYVPLTDASGAPVFLDWDGIHTARLTEVQANDDLQLNFLLFVAQPATPAAAQLMRPSLAGGTFSFEVSTEAGRSYVVEFTNALGGQAAWTTLTTITGDGSVHSVSDSVAGIRRFYRVRVE